MNEPVYDNVPLAGTAPRAANPATVKSEPGSIRVQFGGACRLGGCVAWDAATGLLAVELQPADDDGGSTHDSIAVAIVDPQAPESHFVAHMPAHHSSAAEDAHHPGLAALLWSPPGGRRLLLAVTAAGTAYSWTMEAPADAAEEPESEAVAAEAAGKPGGSAPHTRSTRPHAPVPCINQWFGQLAFQLPLGTAASSPAPEQQQEERQPPRLLCCRFLEPPSAAAALAADQAPPFSDTPQSLDNVLVFYQQHGLERAFCRQPTAPDALHSASAGQTVAAAVKLEQANAAAPASAAGQAAAPVQMAQQQGGASAAAEEQSPPEQQRPHWLRRGALCFAAVASGGELLLACSGRGGIGGGSPSSKAGDSWELAAPVRLLSVLPQTPAGPEEAGTLAGSSAAGVGNGMSQLPPQLHQQQQLTVANVSPAAGGSLLVAAGVAAGPISSGEAGGASPRQDVVLWEVCGPPAVPAGAGSPQQQQQRVAQLSLPQALLPPSSEAAGLVFLPGGSTNGIIHMCLFASTERAIASDTETSNARQGGNSLSARLVSCTAESQYKGGAGADSSSAAWKLAVGPELHLADAAHEPHAACHAAAAGGTLCLLLPTAQQLVCLRPGRGGWPGSEHSSSDAAHSGSDCLAHDRAPAAVWLPQRLPPQSAVDADPELRPGQHMASAASQQCCLAVSPNGLHAAVAARGAAALQLVPLLTPPERREEVEAFMLALAKRCCFALLTGSATAGAAWDLCTACSSTVQRWGHQGLVVLQSVVEAAVQAVREEARPQYAATWSRLKASLLAAAAAAHPAAAADQLLASIRADVAAREWMAAAADIFDAHLPERAARLAGGGSKPPAAAGSESRATLVRMLPARYWALWAADFSCYLARCLMYWLKLKQITRKASAAAALDALAEGGDPAGAGKAGEGGGGIGGGGGSPEAFTARQNAATDCLPCVRLLSDAQFFRSFSRLVASVRHFNSVLSSLQRNKQQNNSLHLMGQQLQLMQDTVVLLRALYEAYNKAEAEGEASSAPGNSNDGADAAPQRPERSERGSSYSGVWTLPYGQRPRHVSWHDAAAALQKVKLQSAAGGSLLGRVREHWKQQGAEGESVGALLETAAQLGLLPASAVANPSNGTTSSNGSRGAGGSVAALLEQRTAALLAAEVGEALPTAAADGDVPLVPLPSMPAQALAESIDVASTAVAILQQRQPQQQLDRRRGRANSDDHSEHSGRWRAWEAERNAALGMLPPPPGDNCSAYEGCMDGLTARPLSWEHGPAYAAADGSCATAELRPVAFQPGASLGWQAAYAAAPPAGGQPWKRLRLA